MLILFFCFLFFVRKDLRSVLTKLGERFVSPVQGSSVTCFFVLFFCEKSDGFQECFVVPQSEGLIGGRGCFTKPISPQCYECKEISY